MKKLILAFAAVALLGTVGFGLAASHKAPPTGSPQAGCDPCEVCP